MDLALPDGRRGRLLALALTITLLAALFLVAMRPLIGWYFDRAGELERQTTLLQRMSGLADSIPRLREQARTRKTTDMLPDSGSDALAAATLQSTVQAMARQAGTDLASLETLPVEARGAYRRIALRVSLAAPYPVLVSLLQAIEQHTPGLLIDDLELRALPLRARAASSAVSASLVVIAFRSQQ